MPSVLTFGQPLFGNLQVLLSLFRFISVVFVLMSGGLVPQVISLELPGGVPWGGYCHDPVLLDWTFQILWAGS